MGGTNAKLGPAVGDLTFDESMQLRRTFMLMSGCDGTEKNFVCSYNNFQKHCETYLDDWLAKKVTDRLAVKGKGTESIITFHDFQMFGSAIFKASTEEKFDTIWGILKQEKSNGSNDSEGTEKQFQADEIYQYTRSIIESYVKISQHSPQIVSWAHVLAPLSPDFVNDLAYYLLQDLFFKGVNEKELIGKAEKDPMGMKESDGSPKRFSMDDVVKALSQNLLFLKIHSTVYSECFGFLKSLYSSTDILPLCYYVSTSSGHTGFSILDLSKLIFLNVQLPPECRIYWKLLFSTSSHGESFSKLLSNIQSKGPTLLIIKDNSGRIFGAYASESWNLNPKFYGDEKSFLFHLSPRFVTYSPTGYNKNFQYFNVQQKTLPNGLGMGGTLEYFGLWLDSEFGKGKCSPSCTTFNCPQLSTNPEFTINHLEVWGVGEEPKKEEGVRDQSILDKDPEAKAMLEMMGKAHVSEGVREVPKDN